MKTQLLCILLLLIQWVQSDAITETHVDYVSYCLQGSAMLRRVSRKVDIEHSSALISVGRWRQFPDMTIQFQVPFGQYVFIKYHIVAATTSVTFLITRLMIDSQEQGEFRMLTEGFYDHNNEVGDQIWLEKGTHFAKVEYKTPSGNTNYNVNQDYLKAVFIVRYFEF